jgi:glycosyltransferase involved in cell wall biosynthesis
MKVLVVLPYSPYPVRRGQDRLISNLVSGLSENHEVVLVTMTLTGEEAEALSGMGMRNVSVRSIVAPNRRSILHRGAYKAVNVCKAVLMGIPLDVGYAAPRAFLDLVAETAHRERADLVLASYWHLYELPARVTGPHCVLITHDVDYLVHSDRLGFVRGGLKRLYMRIDARMKGRVEREAYRRYRSVLALTERDAQAVRDVVGGDAGKVLTLPLAIDLERYEPGAYERRSDRILFMGALDADFNRDALIYFVRSVFPGVLERRPSARLDVVGYGADESLKELASSRIVFHGGVEDIRPHLGRCSLMVLPLRFGGGVRIRMMEAAGMGTAVVSTPTGVAGMGLVDERDYLEARDAPAMSNAILRLLNDPAVGERLGRNVREWARRHISMKDYPERLEGLFSALDISSSKSRM